LHHDLILLFDTINSVSETNLSKNLLIRIHRNSDDEGKAVFKMNREKRRQEINGTEFIIKFNSRA